MTAAIAITKIRAIKTSLNTSIQYITNPDKTAGGLLVGSFNCRPAEAYHQMMDTKSAFGKEGGRQGYHLIQSFAPGEVTAETAFSIAQEYVRQYLSDRYEAVFAIHEDKDHVHAHIIWNAVSFVDGLKYHADNREYPDRIRHISDDLCRAHGLSVIEPQGKGLHYTEHMAQQQGNPTIRGQIRTEIDEIIGQSYNLTVFWENLRKQGYSVRRGKYISIRSLYSSRSIRLESLGPEYTESGIQSRIMQIRKRAVVPPRPGAAVVTMPPPGYRDFYGYYLGVLNGARTRQLRPQLSAAVRESIRAIENMKAQHSFLAQYSIQTRPQLDQYEAHLDSLISALTDHRADLHRARRRGEQTAHSPQDVTTHLRALRKEKRLIEGIKREAPTAYQQVQRIVEIQERERTRQKNRKHSRRNAIV